MSEIRLARTSALAYREALPAGEPEGAPVLFLHGFPETSFMWRDLMMAVADAGHHAYAPDMPAMGDSPPDPPNTWDRLVEAVGAFVDEVELPRAIVVVHDWGGLIGLRWACEHPERVAALVIAGCNFFPDAKWSGMAAGLRLPGTGEEMFDRIDRDGFGELFAAVSPGMKDEAIDEYWRWLSTEAGRRATLEMYRSDDFDVLAPYDGTLGRLGVPTLILWGENDRFTPLADAHRLHREIPGSQLEIVAGASHFVFADAPAETRAALMAFLDSL